MPRQARIDAPGALHHIIARGIERRKIFRNDKDKDDFIKRLQKVLTETGTPCYAWALIPNHFHLLLRTGNVPVSSVMRKLLTGYAVSFNRKYQRHGHLFQNRYKSILCQEDLYFKELIRYIHLNPLRANLVDSLGELDRYKYSGHSAIMGNVDIEWYPVNSILELFSSKVSSAQKRYLNFVKDGLDQGKRDDLIGGGLIRSHGGWENVKAMRKAKDFQKSDERILGESDFVEKILQHANEFQNRKEQFSSMEIDLQTLIRHVSTRFKINISDLYNRGKERNKVKAKSLICYWAHRELDISMTALSKEFKTSITSISNSVKRGEKVALENGYSISDLLDSNR